MRYVHYVRIRHAGFGSLPISKDAWLSALGPVVSDPASASGISAVCEDTVTRVTGDIDRTHGR